MIAAELYWRECAQIWDGPDATRKTVCSISRHIGNSCIPQKRPVTPLVGPIFPLHLHRAQSLSLAASRSLGMRDFCAHLVCCCAMDGASTEPVHGTREFHIHCALFYCCSDCRLLYQE